MDRLNEDRLEKTNRVKLVEREKAALEAAKKEADGYLKDQNELTKRRNELFQVYAMRYTGLIAGAQSHVVSRVEKPVKSKVLTKQSTGQGNSGTTERTGQSSWHSKRGRGAGDGLQSSCCRPCRVGQEH